MQRFLRLAGFLGQAAGTAEEQAKNFRWGLHKSILDHVMCIQFTDVAQVADAARNLEILRDRDDYDRSERSDKRHKSGDRYQSATQQNNYRGHDQKKMSSRVDRQAGRNSGAGRDQRNRGQQSHRSTNSGSQQSRVPSEGYTHPVCTTCGRRHPGECRRAAGTCFKCGQAGHLQRDCKKNTGASSSGHADKKPDASGRVFALTQDQAANTSALVFMELDDEFFHEFLDKFVIVFNDPILWSSLSLRGNTRAFRTVLQILRQEKLYAKFSKCEFWLSKVAFLGHIVSVSQEFTMDRRRLRLSQNGQDRRLLYWNEEREKSFEELKQRLVSSPILTLPSGTGGFQIYSDASKKGLGCVLMQHGKVIAYALETKGPMRSLNIIFTQLRIKYEDRDVVGDTKGFDTNIQYIQVEEEIICDLERLDIELCVRGQNGLLGLYMISRQSFVVDDDGIYGSGSTKMYHDLKQTLFGESGMWVIEVEIPVGVLGRAISMDFVYRVSPRTQRSTMLSGVVLNVPTRILFDYTVLVSDRIDRASRFTYRFWKVYRMLGEPGLKDNACSVLLDQVGERILLRVGDDWVTNEIRWLEFQPGGTCFLEQYHLRYLHVHNVFHVIITSETVKTESEEQDDPFVKILWRISSRAEEKPLGDPRSLYDFLSYFLSTEWYVLLARTNNQEKDEKQSQNDKTGLGMEKTVKDKAKSKPKKSGYHQKDRKPSQNDKTEHGMEKTVKNQGQRPKKVKVKVKTEESAVKPEPIN
ncbi:zinc finger, CCHC-type, retrotransposon gag domain protein [Tanacetum coccineum]